MFAAGTRLSDIALKWMADESVAHGLLVRRNVYRDASKLTGVDPAGPIHKMNVWWRLLGRGGRVIPNGAKIHASVEDRIHSDESYAKRLPAQFTFVDEAWRTALPWPKPFEASLPKPDKENEPYTGPDESGLQSGRQRTRSSSCLAHAHRC